MKKITKILVCLLIGVGFSLCVCSCSYSNYQQISTLESNQVRMDSTGQYMVNEDFVTIKYDFWAKSGSVSFWVVNNTKEDVYLDLSKSYLIKNGAAYDYYRNRIFKVSSSSGISEGASVSASVGVGIGVTKDGAWVRDVHSNTSAKKSASVSAYAYTMNEKGTEFVEQRIVCIPSESYKYFDEYNVSSQLYRECGFGRFPSSDEESIKEFDIHNSPMVIDNRLVFVKDNVEIPVSHIFYISKIQNIAQNDALVETYPKDCQGNQSIEPVYYHKLGGPNRFYVVYKR